MERLDTISGYHYLSRMNPMGSLVLVERIEAGCTRLEAHWNQAGWDVFELGEQVHRRSTPIGDSDFTCSRGLLFRWWVARCEVGETDPGKGGRLVKRGALTYSQ